MEKYQVNRVVLETEMAQLAQGLCVDDIAKLVMSDIQAALVETITKRHSKSIDLVIDNEAGTATYSLTLVVGTMPDYTKKIREAFDSGYALGQQAKDETKQ